MSGDATNSIISKLEYSAKLQQGFLPKKRHFDRCFSDSFVIYNPAEYLSGDFYWIARKDHLCYAAVGDCTGHGVSAAFLSMLGYNYLNYAVLHKGLLYLDDILKELDKQIIETFSSVNNDHFDNDWIDIAIICYDTLNQKLHFAGANRKVLIINENQEVQILKGAKYPIGGWQLEKQRDFPVQTINLNKAYIYMGSDGFQDQFNESDSLKFGSKRLHELIKGIASLSMLSQKRILEKELKDWSGKNEQTDDICLLGLKI